MEFIKVVIIAIIVVFAMVGLFKGIVGELAAIFSVVLSILGLALVVRGIDSFLAENTNGLIQAVVFFVVLAFLSQILQFLFKSLKILAKLPLIHGLDKILGLIAGIAEGILIVWAMFVVLEKYDVAGKSAEWLAIIKADPYLSKLSARNPFLQLFGMKYGIK